MIRTVTVTFSFESEQSAKEAMDNVAAMILMVETDLPAEDGDITIECEGERKTLQQYIDEETE